MRKLIFLVTITCFMLNVIESNAQVTMPSFGKGIRVMAQDSSFSLKLGFRFQTLYQSDWNLEGDEFSGLEDHSSTMLIRRSRLKFSGYAINPKFTYKAELALSNRDNGGGNSSLYNNAANIILDASVKWNFYKGLSIWAGQGKMLGNRERVVSSGNLQFVDRSRLNSRFTLDRDVGVMLINKHKLNNDFVIVESVSLCSGEGKNLTVSNMGGAAYTAKVEFFPFGDFQSKGAYTGSAVKFEETPKLAVAVAFDKNFDAGRTRGQKGSFLFDSNGNAVGKDLTTLFVDMMFKYKHWSFMGEYVTRAAEGDSPNVVDEEDHVIGTYYTGNATNFAVGYMFDNDVELAVRYTDVNPEEDVASPENQYTFGVSKFIRGHKLKVQTDVTYRVIDLSEDDLIYRLQVDLHF